MLVTVKLLVIHCLTIAKQASFSLDTLLIQVYDYFKNHYRVLVEFISHISYVAGVIIFVY